MGNPSASKEDRCFKALTEHSQPKAGFVFWRDTSADLFYWSDLMRVRYKPKPDEDDRPEESIIFYFHQVVVTIWGNQLGDIFSECQKHLIDWIRISSKEVIMREVGTIVSAIEIREEKKQPPKAEKERSGKAHGAASRDDS